MPQIEENYATRQSKHRIPTYHYYAIIYNRYQFAWLNALKVIFLCKRRWNSFFLNIMFKISYFIGLGSAVFWLIPLSTLIQANWTHERSLHCSGNLLLIYCLCSKSLNNLWCSEICQNIVLILYQLITGWLHLDRAYVKARIRCSHRCKSHLSRGTKDSGMIGATTYEPRLSLLTQKT